MDRSATNRGIRLARAVEGSNLTVQIAALRRAFGEAGRFRRDRDAAAPRLSLCRTDSRERNLVGGDVARFPARSARQAVLAVLSFTNMSDDPQQEYFADGMVEDIIAGLSRIRWLFVFARNSSAAYKGRTAEPKQVGSELGVRYLVQGSVRMDGGRIRIRPR